MKGWGLLDRCGAPGRYISINLWGLSQGRDIYTVREPLLGLVPYYIAFE
jgi:hypothetical protein